MPAVHTGTRTYIHNVIGRIDGVFVVFHHNYGIAQIAKFGQGFNKPFVVALMESDSRFIKNVERPD